MTQEQWKERLPAIQAWIEGKVIQCKRTDGMSAAWGNTDFQIIEPDFSNPYLRWRIKPEPREFWIVAGLLFRTRKDATDYILQSVTIHPSSEIIHVREVLE